MGRAALALLALLSAAPAAAQLPTPAPTATPGQCVGDCDGKGSVVVAELVRMVDCGDGEICRLTTARDCGVPCFGAVLRCFPGCAADADCDGGLCGADHRCAPRPCAADGDCPEHFACSAGECERTSCVADEECSGGFCVRFQCRDRLGTCQVLPA